MHAVYLTEGAWRGIPLAHWGIGLTMLLEKIVRNNFIRKLRAMCLIKANFNWINKIIFARRMIGLALEQNLIPGKRFSKKGSNCIDAVMTKIFICDKSRIHHHDTCIAGNNWRLLRSGCPSNCCYVALEFWSPPTSNQGPPRNNGENAVLFTNRIWWIKDILWRAQWRTPCWLWSGEYCCRSRFYNHEFANC